jgi:rare lipoprotein A
LRPSFTRRMRAVHLIIGTTVLAVPASALAFSGVTAEPVQSLQNPVQTPLNLQVSSHRVSFGDAVTITGTAPATDAGKRVLVQTAAHGQPTWRSLGSARVGPAGTFRARVTPRHSGVLRAVEQAAAAAAPATDRAAAVSPTRSTAPSPRPAITVAARLTPAHHPATVKSTGPVHVSGKLLPALPGRRVRLQGRGSHGWHTLSAAPTGARGGYRLRLAPAEADGRRLRVAFAGDGRNGRTARRVGRVTVLHPALASWYEDGGNTACGFHAGLGVANRTLPCGTKVMLSYGRRTVTAVVDDRGPYAGGRSWDLNQNTASALGFAGVGTVWSDQ